MSIRRLYFVFTSIVAVSLIAGSKVEAARRERMKVFFTIVTLRVFLFVFVSLFLSGVIVAFSDTVVEDCARRYASAAELAADVQRHLNSVPVVARPARVVYKASRWIRRHRAACVSASIGLSLGLLVLAVPQILETVPWRRTMAAISQASIFQPQFKASPLAAAATKDRPFANTLGMRFVPVPGTDVLFCIHETRYKDYAAYAGDTYGVATDWKNQSSYSYSGFSVTERNEDHSVAFVSWEDAQAFCAWLSRKEGNTYRLPTDEEWSAAVGLGSLEKRSQGTTPAMLNGIEDTAFPWGGDFPPKTGDQAGNYSDDSYRTKAPMDKATYIDGYEDEFPTTAPVMSFEPNKFGLYDLGGNMWEWCEDWYDNAQIARVMRGSSWRDSGRRNLLSSFRLPIKPTARLNHNGFRCVLVPSGSAPAAATSPPMKAPPPPMEDHHQRNDSDRPSA